MYVCIPSFFFSLSVIDEALSYRGFDLDSEECF